MSSHTKSMANRAEGIYERLQAGAERACRGNAPKWVATLLTEEAIRMETLAHHVREVHEQHEASRPRTVWDRPQDGTTEGRG